MLRAAALLQLELVRRSVEAGWMLKDSSPYNVQFVGARPVFVDVGSFEPLREGEPWAGYRQFCMLFLYPLMLHAWKDIPFQPRLRGSIDGITPAEARNLLSLSGRDLFHRGVLTDVVLHNRLERRYAGSTSDVKGELKRAGFKKELIVANVGRLERLVSRLQPSRSDSTWSDYGLTTTYTEEDAERKRRFVADAVKAESPRLVWDVGANEGQHSRDAAEVAEYVVAMDADAVVVDRLYGELARGALGADPPTRRERRRPVAGPRLARDGAAAAARARPARPHALPRGPAPRVDLRQRPRRLVSRLAPRPRRRDGDRVPDAGGPDGGATARAQA